jgi:lipopolysaccharide biosynthesis regulator YciM
MISSMVETLQPPVTKADQKVAYVFAEHLRSAKSNKKAAKIFSRTDHKERSRREAKKMARAYFRGTDQSLSQDEQEALDSIREELEVKDKEYLEEKRNNFKRS